MMEEWKEYKLGDVCTISSSKRIFASEYQKAGIPFYRGKEIIEKQNGTSISNELFISEERFNEIKSKYGVPKEGDMLLSSVGTLGVPYIVHDETFYFKDGNLTWFYDYKNINNYFLYYWFLSPKARFLIDTKAIGSTQKALTIETLKKFDILLPSKDTQNKIVAILKSLDDKIEVNRRINENLEQQAQALFKSWFVDFEPFKNGEFVDSELGMIPKGWRVGKLSEIADYVNGLAMQKFRPQNNEQGLPVLKIKELGQGSFDVNTEQCSPSLIGEKYIIHDGDIIFSWSGTLMVKIWCGGLCGLNQHLFVVVPKNYPKWFVYLWTLYHLDNFIRIAKDKAVTMGHIKRGELDKALVAIPDKDEMEKCDALIAPIFKQIISNEIESRRLASLRDTLLPKLMSGELRVGDVGR